MPPKAKISKRMVLDAVLDITRKDGFEAVNARSIAAALNCSTRPIFTCYDNMEELKKEFLDLAFDFYTQYVENYRSHANIHPCLILPLSYILFAREETHLFKLLFISDMALNMAEANDFYKEIGNEKKAKLFSDMLEMNLERGRAIFLDLFLYSHGIAVLTATGKVFLEQDAAEKMVSELLSALVKREKPDWDISRW